MHNLFSFNDDGIPGANTLENVYTLDLAGCTGIIDASVSGDECTLPYSLTLIILVQRVKCKIYTFPNALTSGILVLSDKIKVCTLP